MNKIKELSARFESQFGAAKIIKNLLNCKFDKVWKGEEYIQFETFVLKAIPKGGFLIRVPLKDGNVWLLYKTAGADERGIQISHPEVAVPKENIPSETRDLCPEEWNEYPIWDLEESEH